MALIHQCFRCKHQKLIDTHCSTEVFICFDCLETNSDLHHKPDCRIEIKKRIERNATLHYIHTEIDNQLIIKSQSELAISALANTLRQLDPCSECQGINYTACQTCAGQGYNPCPTSDRLNEKMPEATY